MEFSVKSGSPEKQRSACCVVGVYEPRRLSPAAEVLDKASDDFISTILRRGDLDGKSGQILLLHNVPNALCDRVLLVGCGKERALAENQYREIIQKAVKTLNDTGSMDAVCYLTELNVTGRDIDWKVRFAVEVTEACLYSFDKLKSKVDQTRRPLRRITFSVPSRRDLATTEITLEHGQAIAAGVNATKDLANLPPNICTPSYLAKHCRDLAKHYKKIQTAVLDKKEMQALKMGALLAVGKGSDNAPKLITMQYANGPKSQKPVVLVGKGITFDTGGNSLKSPKGMIGMKYDMCGAAAVIGTLTAVAKLELPINVVGVIAAAENMPGGKASRPDDVITSLSGTTVEILNTDAEGRLVLCDALSYCERFDPDVVIDIATLTGGCVVALGHHATGLFANHNPLAQDLLNAGQQSYDRAWQLPLWEEYHSQLNSNIADICHVAGPDGSTITAASFLSHFTKKYQWAHLDVAGSAAILTGKNRGATGRPVGLLMQYILNKVEMAACV